MPASGCELCGITILIHCLLFHQKCCHGFECHTEIYVLTITDTALYASTIVGGSVETLGEYIIEFGTTAVDTGKACSILKSLDGINSKHG